MGVNESLSAGLRERVALWVAPWLYFHNREACDEALKQLAEVAYGSRDAVWTSHETLVRSALKEASWQGVNRRAALKRAAVTTREDMRRDTMRPVAFKKRFRDIIEGHEGRASTTSPPTNSPTSGPT